ncbi:MAG: helix-turn-helix domain containing protein [Ancalomicrobiaceae bacterium]|nr:helix-turn-helix domain containing protein [Ancalomicrobiaceae bacterium]
MLHDMNQSGKSSGYNSPLRAKQKEQTGTLILEAVGRLLAHGDPMAVSMAEVARAADVTERTVYRHFETRDDLLRAFWKWQLERGGGERVVDPRTPDELRQNIIRLFTSLDKDEGIVRALMLSPESTDIRRSTNQRRMAHMLAFLDEHIPNLEDSDRHQLAAGIVSVASVQSWMFMRDNCGYSGRQAGEAAALTVDMVLEAARQRAARR